MPWGSDHGRVRGRSRTSVSLALGALGVTVLGCSAKHDPAPGELLLSIDSNLKVPDDVDEIGISVTSADGKTLTTDQLYGMAPSGAAKFPATLAIVRGTADPIDIKVAAYKGGQAFTLRETVTTIPGDRTAVLRVDLNWLDNHTTSGGASSVRSLVGTCGAGQTSIAGTCGSFQLDSATLPAYAAGAIVPSDDSSACVNVDDCLLAGGSGGVVTVPATALTRDGTSCTLVPPGVTGAFNVGLVLPPGGDGWCNATSCVIPLSNDPVEGWQLTSSGLLQLPASVCSNTKVVSLALTPVSDQCPQYVSTHPACQNYGKDGGGEVTSEGGAPDATTGGSDAGDDATTSEAGILHDHYGFPGNAFLGFASDDTESNVVALLKQDAGATSIVVWQTAGNGALSEVAMGALPVDPAATAIDMAAAPGLFAFASGDSVQALSVPSLADAGFLGGSITPLSGLLYAPGRGGSQLGIAGYSLGTANSYLAWQDPDGGFTKQLVYPGPVTALAYDPVSARYAIAEENYGSGTEGSWDVLTLGTLDDAGPANNPAVTVEMFATQAVTFAAPDTLVWWFTDANGMPHLFSALTSASKSMGTEATQTAGFFNGARSMVGGNGRVFWIGSDQHVYTMTFAAGASTGASVDLYPKLDTVLVTQLGMTSTHLLYTDGQMFYRYPLGSLP